jgi:hypothetical protein
MLSLAPRFFSGGLVALPTQTAKLSRLADEIGRQADEPEKARVAAS